MENITITAQATANILTVSTFEIIKKSFFKDGYKYNQEIPTTKEIARYAYVKDEGITKIRVVSNPKIGLDEIVCPILPTDQKI